MPDIYDMDYVVVDTETTGKDPATDAVVEIGAVKWRPKVGILWTWSALVHPFREIPVAAQAVHGIRDAMVEHAPDFATAVFELDYLLHPSDVLVAHNAPFDRAFLGAAFAQRPWVCSLRMARHLWPDAESHSNQFLRYQLGIDTPVSTAHRAGDDARITAAIWEILLHAYHQHVADDLSLESLIAYAESPILVRKMPFGKHMGQPIEQVPTQYLNWVLKNIPDLDSDLKASIEAFLHGPDLFSAHA